ncbi:MAG TPA: FixH family protein [Bdellovibrio sp.]|nr:FixH family protein [Bdellovibrio sp.]
MKAFLVLFLSCLLSLTTFAHDGHEGGTPITSPHAGDHTGEFCTDESESICAHLHFLADVNTSTEGSFTAHIETPENKTVDNLKVDLWMDMGHGHGHGGAPLEIADTGANRYKVTNAWFVMAGTWNVRIDFDFNGTHQHIEIPVNVAQ